MVNGVPPAAGPVDGVIEEIVGVTGAASEYEIKNWAYVT